jgi:hypothetical protein
MTRRGWHDWGRAVVSRVSPSVYGCPPSVRVVVPLKGGSGVCCDVPSSDRVLPFHIVPVLSHCLASLLCCVLWVGKCGGVWCPLPLRCGVCLCVRVVGLCGVWNVGGGRTVSLSSLSSPLPHLCVCCHGIVGLGGRLCVRVVSLWNSGDGLCWVEGCVRCLLSAVYCVLFSLLCCGVCVVVMSHCVVGCGMAVREGCGLVVCLLLFSSFSSSSFVLVFGVVRAQLCEHARYPRTPLCPLVACSSSSFFFSPPFFTVRLSLCWNGGGGDSPCVGVLCWHDGDG